jgi:outer membrane protein assembly factor BamB
MRRTAQQARTSLAVGVALASMISTGASAWQTNDDDGTPVAIPSPGVVEPVQPEDAPPRTFNPALSVGEAVFVDPASQFGQPWDGRTAGMLTFRGNPTRTFNGTGPIPRTAPQIRWTFPEKGGMCAPSRDGQGTRTWCGTGWTGQANLWSRPDGSQWVMFGGMDRAYHFLDATSGEPVLPAFPTGDINKGSATLDPDGYPLYYGGSRDNLLRVFALDREEATVLWELDANDVEPRLWNNDWDSAPLVIGDYLIAGGENSNLHVIELNRFYGTDGKVTVDPRIVFTAPGWDQELLDAIGDQNVSIESSVAVSGTIVYFANSGGLVQGWDLRGIRDGRVPERVFRFWTGDDTDASIVVDDAGFLYVASEYERRNDRSQELGQLMKLDPSRPDDPVVWSFSDDLDDRYDGAAGFWATPALHEGVVIVPTNAGRLLGIDQSTGELLWQRRLAPHVWQSPVIVDDVLLQGDCAGVLRAFDVANPRVLPTELWSVQLNGCIESTPTVWDGRIYVGARGGQFTALW